MGSARGGEESSSASLGQSSHGETDTLKEECRSQVLRKAKTTKMTDQVTRFGFPPGLAERGKYISNLQVYRESISESKAVMLRQAERGAVVRQLGFTDKTSELPTPYHYTPLQGPRHIRLLQIRSYPNVCGYFYPVVSVSLDREPPYEALTYIWRDPTKSCHSGWQIAHS